MRETKFSCKTSSYRGGESSNRTGYLIPTIPSSSFCANSWWRWWTQSPFGRLPSNCRLMSSCAPYEDMLQRMKMTGKVDLWVIMFDCSCKSSFVEGKVTHQLVAWLDDEHMVSSRSMIAFEIAIQIGKASVHLNSHDSGEWDLWYSLKVIVYFHKLRFLSKWQDLRLVDSQKILSCMEKRTSFHHLKGLKQSRYWISNSFLVLIDDRSRRRRTEFLSARSSST